MVEGGQSTSEHGGPDFTHAEGDKLIDLGGLRRHGAGEGEGVLTSDPTGGQKNVLVTEGVGPADDVAAVLVAGAKGVIRNAEKLVVVRAEGGEPSNFAKAFRSADRRHWD